MVEEIPDAEVNSPENIAKRIEAVQKVRPEQVEMEEGLNSEGLTLIGANEEEEVESDECLPIEQRALVRIAPENDEKVTALYNEGVKLLGYAKAREITCNEDMKPATNDLAVITKTKKAIELIRKEYISPIRHHLDAVNFAFKEFIEPLLGADELNRKKLIIYKAEVNRKIAEAKAIEQEKLDLAKREMELTGEHTVDLTPVETPEVASKRVHTDMGSVGTLKTYKWELEDITLVPREYLIPNAVLIGQQVRSSKGTISIPGIRVYTEDSIRVNTR